MHVLATQALSLDEADQAVDLGQTPAAMVVLSFSDTDLSALSAAWHARKDELPTLRLASLKRLRHPMSVDLYIESVIANARAVIVRALGGLEYWRYGIERIAAVAASRGIAFAAVPGCDKPDPRLKSFSTIPQEDVDLIERYFREGGAQNAGNALALMARLSGRDAIAAPPQSIGPVTCLTCDGREISVEAASAEIPADKPTGLITFYRAQLVAGDTAPIRALMAALAREGLSPLALAVTSLKDGAAAPDVETLLAAVKPAVILNATAFSATRDDGSTVLDAADCPVLQVVLAGAGREAWASSPRGLSPTDIAMNVVLPELDGRILTRAISHKSEGALDPDLEVALQRHEPDETRIAFVARLAAAWAKLRRTAPRDLRLALMLSDYPARGGRTGYAVGLDTAASAASILEMLNGAGFSVPALTKDHIEPLLLGDGETLRISLADYRKAFAALPEELRTSITSTWGEPEADPVLRQGAFEVKAIRAGHSIILLQPDRGSHTSTKQGYHDITVPPRHAYVAVYAYLRETFGMNALVHVGTHGTLEWLPGKALALSEACAPEAVLGAVPVVYPFIVNNPGEAVQAKRRIAAVTIGHLTPPLTDAGLHGALAELEGLIEEFAEADGVDRRRTQLLEAEIVERAWASGLAADCGVTKSDTPRDAITRLDAQLCDIKELAVRASLHVFGCPPSADAKANLSAALEAASNLPRETVDALIARSAESERQAVVACLTGRRVAPGPAGAPSRGRADVLPTGRNLSTIDPRAIPTRTAAIVGERAAREVVTRYLQDHGDYPKALVIDLWASASLRTGGDDLAQALAYLGVRPVWDAASNRVTGVEVIPEPKLERPRIDVTLRISGLFRDIFASQIALFEMAVGLVAARDEDDTWNPIAAARRRRENLDRIFGSAPGVYGAAASELALDGSWNERADLGAAYLANTSFAFGANDAARPAAANFRARVEASDALVHAQDDRERDILDGDGVADFAGGFAAARELLGHKATLYHLDTSKPGAPRVRTMTEEITRIVRGRLTNPRWVAAMLAHGARGAAEVAQGVDALFAFAATANAVPSHLFDAVHEALIANDETATALERANPLAADAIARRLEQAIEKQLWTPRRNAVAHELQRLKRGAAPGLVEAAQ